MDELMEAALRFSQRVAGRMTQDEDALSAAAAAAMRALNSWKPTGAPLKKWVASCVKRTVWDWMKRRARRKEEQKADTWWAEVHETSPMEAGEWSGEWQILVEYYIDGWPLDVVARRHCCSTYSMRKQLKAAAARLKQEAM